MRKSVVIFGDLVADVIFSDESKLPIAIAKETLSGPPPDYFAKAGVGGGAYLQMLLEILFDRCETEFMDEFHTSSPASWWKQHVSPIAENFSDNLSDIPDINHWTVAKRPAKLAVSDGSSDVYRAIERTGKQAHPTDEDVQPRLRAVKSPRLLVISDYNRSIRFNQDWEQPDFKNMLTNPGTVRGNETIPNRVILLGNRLPRFCTDGAGKSEPMWKILRDSNQKAKNSTVVVTSLDRLRREGANISKRQSWDDTLLNFQRELVEFEPLKRLCEFGHLIIRTGLVGAIYVKKTASGHKTFFFYDPNAEQVVFRDRALQGTAFALRSVLPASIAMELILESQIIDQYETEVEKDFAETAIRRAVVKSIAISQKIFTAGFGSTKDSLSSYLTDLDFRKDALSKRIEEAMELSPSIKADDLEDSAHPKKRWFIHIACPPKYPISTGDTKHRRFALKRPEPGPDDDLKPQLDRFRRWNLLRDNLRVMLKEDVFDDGTSKKKGFDDAASKLRYLELFRRLRLARSIAYYGLERAVNNLPPHEAAMRGDRDHLEYLELMIQIESGYDKKFRSRVMGEPSAEDLVSCLVPEVHSKHFGEIPSFPLNTPTAIFGNLKVVGRADILNYATIRNLISSHLASRSTRPLNIAAFGAPGSGKSFGIVEISKAIAGSAIEIIECNLSQLTDKKELNPIFFRISEAILKDRTPLVFFDEFDADNYRWVKYFLSPMQDGKFRHPDGVVELRNSIFVFAGGVNSHFAKFQETCVDKTTVERGALDPVAAKLPDFLSRLKGYVDIPGLNRPNEKYKSRYIAGMDHLALPYIRRALILRGALESQPRALDGFGVAQFDRSVMDAFLRTGYYCHGARSMLSILHMCVRWDGRITKSSLPSPAQMNIHTNGMDFTDLIRHGDEMSPLEDLERAKEVEEDVKRGMRFGGPSEMQEAL